MSIKYFSDIQLADNNEAIFGTGSDLKIGHSGTNSFITNITGDINIINQTDNGDIKFQGDDQSGGDTVYFRLDGGTGYVKFEDNRRIAVGSGEDLHIYHDGSNSNIIQGGTGHLKIRQTNDDSDIIFESDDGSGGTTTYFSLDGSITHTRFAKSVLFNDNVNLDFGESGNTRIKTDGSNTFIQNFLGDIIIENAADDQDIIFKNDDGSGGTAEYFKLDGASVRTTFFKQARFDDSVELRLGTSGDVAIFHDGANTHFENKTGNLTIRQEVDDGDIIFKCDDGSGGDTAYITLDGSAAKTIFHKIARIEDNVAFQFGTGGDAFVRHTGSDFEITQSSGNDLIISNEVADKDVIFQSDDGSGGLSTYFFLDGSTTRTVFQKDLKLTDNVNLRLGAGNDTLIVHNGTNTNIKQQSGDLILEQAADDEDIIFKCDNGSGGTTAYITLDGSEARTNIHKDLQFTDNIKGKFGTSGDLEIYHDGSNTYIANKGSAGDLYISNDHADKDVIFQCDDGSGGLATYITLDGSATCVNIAQDIKLTALKKLYFDGGGDTYIVENASNNLQFVVGGNQKLVLGNSGTTHSQHFKLGDTNELQLGTGSDAQFQHTGTNLFLDNKTGEYTFRQKAENADIKFQGNDDAGNSTSVNITALTLDMSDAGTAIFNHDIKLADNGKAFFGGGTDLSIYHDGSNSYILQQTTGDLIIQNSVDDKDIIFKSDDGSGGVATYFQLDGSATRTVFSESASFVDGKFLYFGTGLDAHIKHTGSDLVFVNTAGDVTIQNSTDDGDIKFICDDGSGGNTEYFRIDGGSKQVRITEDFNFLDNAHADFGNSSDLKIYHDGSSSYIENNTGNLNIMTRADDADMVFWGDDGTGGDGEYFRIDSSLSDASSDFRYTVWPDRSVIAIGAGSDLQLYHNATDSHIDNYNGDLYITQHADNKDLIFRADDGSGGFETYFFLDGSASGGAPFTVFPDSSNLTIGTGFDLRLKHDGSHSYIQQTGNGSLFVQNTIDDQDIVFQSDDGSGGVTDYIRIDGSVTTTKFEKQTLHSDNVEAIFGTGSDLKIKHTGTASLIRNFTGNLTLRNAATNKDIILECDDGSGGTTAYITLDGSQEAVVFGKAPHIPEYILHDSDGDTAFGFAAADTFRVITGGTTRLNIATGIEITGNTTIDGNLTVTSEIIHSGDTDTKIAFGTDTITLGTGGNAQVLLSTDDVTLSDNLLLSSAAGQVQFTGTNGGGNEGITYKDSGGGNRYGLLFPGSNVVALANRASNGTVQVRANTSTAGSGGEITVAEFEDDLIKLNKPVQVTRAAEPSDPPANSGVIYLDSNFDLKIKIHGGDGVVTRTLAQYEQ